MTHFKSRVSSLAVLTLLAALLAPSLTGTQALRMWVLAQEAPPSFPLPTTVPQGTALSIDGSASMVAINAALKAQFEASYPGSSVSLSQGGAQAALQALAAGTIDLAAIGRPLTDEEKAQGYVEVPVSREKIAIIVGSNNPFNRDLTFDQFAKIFRGEIADWSQVGGPTGSIRFVDRPEDSDTRRALSDYDIFRVAPFKTGTNAVQVPTDETADIVKQLGSDGISYAIASQVLGQDNVRVISMDGTLPDDARYPYSQPRSYVYKGEPSPAIQAFLGFATGKPGQAAVADAKATEAAEVTTANIPQGAVALSPDGTLLVSSPAEGMVQLWDADGQPLGDPFPAHSGSITAIAFNPNGQSFVTTGADGAVKVWNLEGQPIGNPVVGDQGPITAAAMSPDGKTLVTAGKGGVLTLRDSQGNPLGQVLTGHQGVVRAIAFSPDGQTLFSAGVDKAIHRWPLQGGALDPMPMNQAGTITTLAVSPDGQTLATGDDTGSVQLLDAAGQPKAPANPAHGGAVNSLAFSPNGQVLASGSEDGTVRQWQPDGAPKGEPISTQGPVSSVAFTPDGSLVIGSAGQAPQVGPANSGLAETGDGSDVLPPVASTSPVSRWLDQLSNFANTVPLKFKIALLALLGLLFVLSQLRSGLFGRDDDSPETATDAPPQPPVDGGFGASNGSGASSESTWETDATFSHGQQANNDRDDLVIGEKLAQAKASLKDGLELASQGQYPEALAQLHHAIEAADVERLKAVAAGVSIGSVTPYLARGLARRGNILSVLGEPQKAIASFDKALEIDSEFLNAWISKGNLLLSLERYDEAEFCFDKALELQADSKVATLGKGNALIGLGRTTEGQSYVQRAAELPDDDDAIELKKLGVATIGGVAAGLAGAGLLAFDAFKRVTTDEDTDADMAVAEAGQPVEAVIPPADADIDDLDQGTDTDSRNADERGHDINATLPEPVYPPDEIQALIEGDEEGAFDDDLGLPPEAFSPPATDSEGDIDLETQVASDPLATLPGADLTDDLLDQPGSDLFAGEPGEDLFADETDGLSRDFDPLADFAMPEEATAIPLAGEALSDALTDELLGGNSDQDLDQDLFGEAEPDLFTEAMDLNQGLGDETFVAHPVEETSLLGDFPSTEAIFDEDDTLIADNDLLDSPPQEATPTTQDETEILGLASVPSVDSNLGDSLFGDDGILGDLPEDETQAIVFSDDTDIMGIPPSSPQEDDFEENLFGDAGLLEDLPEAEVSDVDLSGETDIMGLSPASPLEPDLEDNLFGDAGLLEALPEADGNDIDLSGETDIMDTPQEADFEDSLFGDDGLLEDFPENGSNTIDLSGETDIMDMPSSPAEEPSDLDDNLFGEGGLDEFLVGDSPAASSSSTVPSLEDAFAAPEEEVNLDESLFGEGGLDDFLSGDSSPPHTSSDLDLLGDPLLGESSEGDLGEDLFGESVLGESSDSEPFAGFAEGELVTDMLDLDLPGEEDDMLGIPEASSPSLPDELQDFLAGFPPDESTSELDDLDWPDPDQESPR